MEGSRGAFCSDQLLPDEAIEAAADRGWCAVKLARDGFRGPNRPWRTVHQQQHLELLDRINSAQNKTTDVFGKSRGHELRVMNVPGPG